MKTCVVMPAFNEGDNVKTAISGLEKYVDKIIVVDDGSKDNTSEIIKNNNSVTLLRHQVNLGKGAALKTACDAALKLGMDIIICMDSDNQHNPQEIPLFIKKIKEGYDIVYGSRVFDKKMPFTMLVGNKLLSSTIRRLFNIFISDTQSGYRAFTAEAYQKIRWESSGYDVETEMIIKTGRHKLKFTEIEIETIYHDNYKGTTPINGLQIFFKILKWKFL